VEQQVLPTFAVIIGSGGGNMRAVGDIDMTKLVHGEQAIELAGPIPVEGTVKTTGKITGIYDKGKGAVIVTEARSSLVSDGEPLFTTTMSAFIRGEGGFGGDRGPSGPRNVAPERAPDASVTYTTRPEQALIYRLSGDRNPLHADPKFAAMGGFDRPILHGLCTYGFTGRALLNALCGGDNEKFEHMEGRFSSPVFPGESLTIDMWKIADGEAVFATKGGDGRTVIDAGLCRYKD
jgi:acyl dehydratase